MFDNPLDTIEYLDLHDSQADWQTLSLKLCEPKKMPVFCEVGPGEILIAAGDAKFKVMILRVAERGSEFVTSHVLCETPFKLYNGWNNQAHLEIPGESMLMLGRDENEHYFLARFDLRSYKFTRITDGNLARV